MMEKFDEFIEKHKEKVFKIGLVMLCLAAGGLVLGNGNFDGISYFLITMGFGFAGLVAIYDAIKEMRSSK
jgi:hypothetical protein